jgi:hypothetical protein
MKRGTFKRPEYQRPPRAPIQPLVGCRGVYAPAANEPVVVAKVSPARSESYRRWVASLPCIVCGIEGYSQAAHPNCGRGLGQKASDLECFPLCSTRPGHMGHHAEHDLLIEMTLAERRQLEQQYIAKTQATARAVGRGELA